MLRLREVPAVDERDSPLDGRLGRHQNRPKYMTPPGPSASPDLSPTITADETIGTSVSPTERWRYIRASADESIITVASVWTNHAGSAGGLVDRDHSANPQVGRYIRIWASKGAPVFSGVDFGYDFPRVSRS